MSNASVIFYAIQSDFFSIAYKLIEKMYMQRERILFLCDNDDEMNFYNSKLWTSVQLSFIPSGNRTTISPEDAIFCFVWFATKITFLNNPTCILHNGLDISNNPEITNFSKIVDVFSKDTMNSAKRRSQKYKDSGFTDQKLWVQDGISWKQEYFV